jgi:hypothetical protein
MRVKYYVRISKGCNFNWENELKLWYSVDFIKKIERSVSLILVILDFSSL